MHIFWFDEPKDIDKWSRIFLKTSKDNGLTWENWGPPKKGNVTLKLFSSAQTSSAAVFFLLFLCFKLMAEDSLPK